MELKIEGKKLLEGIKSALGFTDQKNPMEHLRTIWLTGKDRLIVQATNGQADFQGEYPAEVIMTGKTGVNGRMLVDLIKRLPDGELILRSVEGGMEVLQGRKHYKLPVFSTNSCPSFATIPDTPPFVLDGKLLKISLDRAGDFTGGEGVSLTCLECVKFLPAKCEYEGAVLGVVEVAALDGYQFALAPFVSDELATSLPGEGVLMHRHQVEALRRWLPGRKVDGWVDGKRFVVRFDDNGGSEAVSILVSSGEVFPNYKSFTDKIAHADSAVSLPREALVAALDRLTLFTGEGSEGVCVKLEADKIGLTAGALPLGRPAKPLPALTPNH
jgi:DNA polymerase-3 subunit beta